MGAGKWCSVAVRQPRKRPAWSWYADDGRGMVRFGEDPGRLTVVYYPVYIHSPGRYYVWARTCPTGSEDSGLDVGLDGKWPGSGLRMQ